MNLIKNQVKFLTKSALQLSRTVISTEYSETSKITLDKSITFLKSSIQIINIFKLCPIDDFRLRSYLKPSKQNKLVAENIIAPKMFYLGQTKDCLPDGFGAACMATDQLQSVLDFPCVADTFPISTFVILGFWKAGILSGPGVIHHTAEAWRTGSRGRDLNFYEDEGWFVNGELGGLGRTLIRRYESGMNKWAVKTTKESIQKNEIVLGTFVNGVLRGQGCIECYDKQQQQLAKSKGIFYENLLCNGEMAKNNGNGEGSTRYIQNIDPYLEIVTSQCGQFNNYMLCNGTQSTSFDVNYEGTFDKNQIIRGKQFMNTPDHYIYDGNFENGIPEGIGSLQLKLNEKYDGYFHSIQIKSNNDKQYCKSNFQHKLALQLLSGEISKKTGNGDGQITCFDLEEAKIIYTRQGKFANFEQVSGVMALPNGASYTGSFSKNYPCGDGVLSTFDGLVYAGTFRTHKYPNNDQIQCISKLNGKEVKYSFTLDFEQLTTNFSNLPHQASVNQWKVQKYSVSYENEGNCKKREEKLLKIIKYQKLFYLNQLAKKMKEANMVQILLIAVLVIVLFL